MSPEALQMLKGTLELDPTKRLSAVDCLAEPWFDEIREPEVDQLIRAHRQLKEQERVMVKRESMWKGVSQKNQDE